MVKPPLSPIAESRLLVGMSPAERKQFYWENFWRLLSDPKVRRFSEKHIAAPARRAGFKEGMEKSMKKGMKKGMEKGKQAAYVGILLEILDHRGIQLSKAMAAKLRKLPMSRQPPAMLALTVKSAAEFIARAQLCTDHQ